LRSEESYALCIPAMQVGDLNDGIACRRPCMGDPDSLANGQDDGLFSLDSWLFSLFHALLHPGMPKNVFTFTQVHFLLKPHYQAGKNTKPSKTPNNHCQIRATKWLFFDFYLCRFLSVTVFLLKTHSPE